MELMTEEKKAFKQTDVGLIPEDWKKVMINDVLELLTDYDANGSFASVAQNVRVYNKEEYAWYVRSTDLENKSGVNEIKYVDKLSYDFLKKTSLHGGELLLLKRGDIGKVYLFEPLTKKATLAPNLYLLKLDTDLVSPTFLFYFFVSEKGQLQLTSKNASSTIGALYKDDVKAIKVPLPTLSEQKAIASALSDVDELIRSLDRLIQKKQAIKKGTMQKLLTGKKRLPGFDGEWEVKKIGEIVDVDPENLSSSTNPDYEFEYLSLEDVNRGVIKSKTKHRYADSPSRARRILREGDVGFGTVRPTNQSHFLIENEVNDLICSTGFAVMRPQSKVVNSEYLFYSLFTYQISEQVNQIIAGSNYPAVNSRDVKNLKLNFPTDIEEQKAIAQILSDMDRELQTLRQKREKYVQIKQGMMQELLTGKTRLV